MFTTRMVGQMTCVAAELPPNGCPVDKLPTPEPCQWHRYLMRDTSNGDIGVLKVRSSHLYPAWVALLFWVKLVLWWLSVVTSQGTERLYRKSIRGCHLLFILRREDAYSYNRHLVVEERFSVIKAAEVEISAFTERLLTVNQSRNYLLYSWKTHRQNDCKRYKQENAPSQRQAWSTAYCGIRCTASVTERGP